MSQQTFVEYCQERAGRIPDDLELDVRLQLNSQYEARQGKYIHVPIYHPSHVSIIHASSHFSIALSALKSLYISHLISPSRCLLCFEITLYFSSLFSIALPALKSLYVSHLISPLRCLL
jgi:hypothetical protein